MTRTNVIIVAGTNEVKYEDTPAAEEKLINDSVEAEETKKAEEETAKQAKEDLKVSAKAKLVAGEPLTEAEADTLVI
tara:strand:+ start:664 stop:894 length:231 start_codon:yes stop_codon:yes gene_type:complete